MMLPEEYDDVADAGTSEIARVPGNDIQVIARAAQLLRLLTVGDTIDVVAAARALDIGRSSAHRYLASMERHGLLVRKDRNSYEAGTLMTQLGAAAIARSGVIRVARPRMEALRDEVQQTITLALWNGATAVVAHVTEDTTRTAHVSVRVGRALRPESAQTVIFSAFAGGERLPAVREDDAFEQVHRAGVAVREGREEGVRAVAVPIMDPSGSILATLAAIGVAQLVPQSDDSDLARALTRASKRITRALGAAKQQTTDHPMNGERRK